MFLRNLLLGFSAIFFLIGCDGKANPWPTIAKTDLDYIKLMVEENHPGYVDPDNPALKTELNKNYNNAISQLQYVQSLDAVLNVTREFVAGFADDHFVAYFHFSREYKVWAGIKIERKGQQYRVTKVANGWQVALPALGLELVACDGRASSEIMNTDILRYRFANYKDNFPRVYFASKLLIDDGIGYRKLAKECVFRDGSANEITLPIAWQPLANVSAEWDASIRANTDSFYIEPISQSLVWVRVPTFNPVGSELEKFTGITQSLADMHLGSDKTIVFDVRENGGGNSVLGIRLLESTLGKLEFWSLMGKNSHGNGERARFRTSHDNLNQIRKRIMGDKTDASSQAYNTELAAMMEQDLKHHQTFTLQPETNLGDTVKDILAMPDIKKSLPQIILLTDHFCASSCLNFVQLVATIPNALHVGEETDADSRYNEPLHVYDPIELPSKLGVFYFPSKILEPRGPFVPSIKFEGDMSDTNALKNWVSHLPQLK